jgi:hypothetical protein
VPLSSFQETFQPYPGAVWQGIFKPSGQVIAPCVVIAEGWPSWLLVLSSHHLTCEMCFTSELLSDQAQQKLDCTFSPISSFESMKHSLKSTIYLVQGSPTLFTLLPADWFKHRQILCCLSDRAPAALWSWPQFGLSHLHCGGVLDNTSYISSNVGMISSKLPSKDGRSLCHLIDLTKSPGHYTVAPHLLHLFL